MDSYEIKSREWWAQQWIYLLETSRFKKRLERAREYARQGNILKLEFQNSKVFALVQGTEAEPYQVSISLDPFSDEQWGYAIETMSQRAIFSAQLLAGEMPQNIEEVFTSNGLSLFPFTLSDIHSRCSCPDKEKPCKHIGAVYYQLGDRFSEDPFVIFQLRGRTKEQILAALRQVRVASGSSLAVNKEERSTNDNQQLQTRSVAEEKLGQVSEITSSNISTLHDRANNQQLTTNQLEQFWQYDEPLDSSLVVIAPPPNSDTVLDLLGPIPFAQISATPGSKSSDAQLVMQYLDAVYKAVSQQAVLSAMNVSET